ncbi:hypothetical protein ACTMTJ_08260 [Phytohabitans sp. LJ34]|uniref:hypothetical protein n=1 Tax=Phytohabitans sp. LJ34 TaxID=3452217 RepID=UPI003F8C2AD8
MRLPGNTAVAVAAGDPLRWLVLQRSTPESADHSGPEEKNDPDDAEPQQAIDGDPNDCQNEPQRHQHNEEYEHDNLPRL